MHVPRIDFIKGNPLHEAVFSVLYGERRYWQAFGTLHAVAQAELLPASDAVKPLGDAHHLCPPCLNTCFLVEFAQGGGQAVLVQLHGAARQEPEPGVWYGIGQELPVRHVNQVNAQLEVRAVNIESQVPPRLAFTFTDDDVPELAGGHVQQGEGSRERAAVG